MTGWITSALLAAAASAALAQTPVVVGAVVSQSGAHAAAATEYRKALLLWADEINGAGGLVGRPVELRIEDDGSEAVRAGSAYAELIRGGADVLIGPYGSGAAPPRAAQAGRAPPPLPNAPGPPGHHR